MRLAWMTLSLMLVMPAAHADRIYRWVGPDNKVYYGDLPPQGARKLESLASKPGTGSASPTAPAESPEIVVRREADCTEKQAQLDTYLTAARLIEKDQQGQERELSSQERETLVARTRSQIETQCGAAP
ncbi:MAG: DUF4124 domain-containing protein [Panacagrimonas sp.]